MIKKFWLIRTLQYSGYDCDGHAIPNIYWGTFIEAGREFFKYDECCIGTQERKILNMGVTEFTLPDVSKKKKGFYVV